MNVLFSAVTNDAADLFFRNKPGHFREDVDHRDEKGRIVVVIFQIRQVDEISLSLLKSTSHDDASSLETSFRRFV